MNKGLKNYTKQITHNVGGANISVNLCKKDANMHIELPLVSTVGENPFGTCLIYNYQDRDESTIFGKGFKLNYYAKKTENGSNISIINADGSIDYYILDQWNSETQMKPTKIYDDEYEISSHIEIVDKLGNTQIYGPLSEYPKKIIMKSGKELSLNFIDKIRTIDNGKDDVISLIDNENGLIGLVEYSHKMINATSAFLSYENGYLTKITYYNEQTVSSSISLNYGDNFIIVKDDVSGYRIKYNITDNEVVSFIDGYDDNFTHGFQTSIAYEDNKTTITDNKNKKSYVVFDNDGIPLYEMDEDGYAVKTTFDKETKQLVSQSSVIATKKNKLSNLFSSESLESFICKDATIKKSECTDELFSGILGDSVYKLSCEKAFGFLRKTTPIKGLATDNITAVIWGKQLTPCTDDSYVRVRLNLEGKWGDYVKFDKKSVDGKFELMVLGITADKSFNYVNMQIEVVGKASIEIGGIQVLKKDFGSFYTYDENGNHVYTLSGSGSSSTEYENNLPSATISEDSTKTEYSYKDNRLTKTLGAYGVTTDYVYDENHKSNLLSAKVTNDDENKFLETKREYTSDGRFVSKTIDELNNETKYEYDGLGRIKKVINALNVTSEYKYNYDGTLNRIVTSYGGDGLNAEYTYNDKKMLSTITLANGSVYSFAYDDYNNITSVSLNGTLLYSYEYDLGTGNLIKQKYGFNGDAYKFEYNEDGQITAVYYRNFNGATQKRYAYEYNAKKQLTKVTDDSSNIIAEYLYDDDGNLIKVTNDAKSISNTYDNLGNIATKSTEVNGKTIHTSYDSVSRSKGSQPDSLLAAFDDKECHISTFDRFTGLRLLRAGKEGIIGYGDTANYPIELGLSNLESSDKDGISGCYQFWFKANSTQSTTARRYLLTAKSSKNSTSIRIYLENNDVFMYITDENRIWHPLITMESCVDLTKWNFISLSFKYYNEATYAEYALTVNEKTKVYNFGDTEIINIALGTSPLVAIGHNNISEPDPIEAKITAIYLSKEALTLEEVKKYYRLSKDYLIDNQLLDDKLSTVDFSATNLYTFDSDIQDLFEIYPLQNNLLSLKGKKPDKFSLRIISDADKDRTFNFNKKIKRYAYVADGGELSYNLGDIDDISVVMRAYTDVNEEKQYFFDGVDRDGETLGLFRDYNNEVCIDFYGLMFNTGLKFTTNEWHSISFSLTKTVSSDSLPSKVESHFRVIVDDKEYTRSFPIGYSYHDLPLMIGRKTEGESQTYKLGNNTTVYPLYGQIEMLTIADAYCEKSTLEKLFSQIKGITKTHEFDDFGMLRKTDVHECGKSILSNKLSYKTRDSKYISTQIKVESISANNSVFANRWYATDAIGQVTAISDLTFGSHSYSYDHNGYLVKADDTTYSYDKNGNITQIGDKVLTYDSHIKDRLMSYDGFNITYDTHNPFNVASYKGNHFTYEGRRLVKVVLSSGYYDYKYNDQGLRTLKKDYRGARTDFEYDGDKLIYQYNFDGRLDFLYDENGELYGLIKDSQDKYFYVRDCLKNILGIVDISGNLVVKYSYDAYGKCTLVSDTSHANIGRINPFRFKGYYLDSETGFYYCKSRYYVPEWGRWLTADSVEYLVPTSVNGMNLYAYCYNDPINYCDPSGHIPLDTLIDIVFACLSLKELIDNPSWENAGWFALDLACFIIPYATGGSTAVKGVLKGVNGADNLLDATKVPKHIMKNADNVVILGQNMNRVRDAAKKIGGGILYGGLDDFAEISLKYGDDVANSMAYIDNIKWVAKQAWSGKTVLNIGLDLKRLNKPLKYAQSFKVCRGELFCYRMVMLGKFAAFWSHRIYRVFFGGF